MIGIGNMLDPEIKKLALAIRQHESGGNYDAKGGSGEGGAYQFMPSTWNSWAGKYLGNSNASQTRQNQNKVAYMQIKSLKDQGLSPAQIASTWNSGGPEWEGKVGINKYGIHYDVPAYVRNVMANYKKNKGIDVSTKTEAGPRSPDFWKKVDDKRKELYSDTQILNKLSEKNGAINKIVRMSRKRYDAENTKITNDRELLNSLSEKLSGKMPTVESNPDYKYLEEQANDVILRLKEKIEKRAEEQEERASFSGKLSDIIKVGKETGGSIWDTMKDRWNRFKEAGISARIPFTKKDEKMREGKQSVYTNTPITDENIIVSGMEQAAQPVLLAGDIGWEVIKGLAKSANVLSGGYLKREFEPEMKEFFEDVSQALKDAPKVVLDGIRNDEKANWFGKNGEEIATWLENEGKMLINRLKTDDKLRRRLEVPIAVIEAASFKTSKPLADAGAEIVGDSLKVAKEGAGEVLEGAGNVIKKKLKKQREKEALDVTQPKITEKYKNEVVERLDKNGHIIPNKWEKDVARTVSDIVDINKKPEINVRRIKDEIGKVSEDIKSVLKDNDAIFNRNQLKHFVTEAIKDVDDALVPESRIIKVKDEIIDALMGKVKKHKISDLWDARKQFDNILDEKLKAFGGQFTFKKDIARTVRQAVNDFIIKKSPQLVRKVDGVKTHPFKEAMSKIHKMYVAKDNIKAKVPKTAINKTMLQRIATPIKAWSHKVGIAGIAGGVGGGIAIASIPSLLINPATIASILAYGSYRVGKKILTSKALKEFLSDFLTKAGKHLNPKEKRAIEDLIKELKNNEKGFAKLPGKEIDENLLDSVYAELKKLKKSSSKTNVDDQIERRLVVDGFIKKIEAGEMNQNDLLDATEYLKLNDIDVNKPLPKAKGETPSKLETEAKKYKSADEFVGAQPIKTRELKGSMQHRPSFEGMPPSYDLLKGETLPRDVYAKPDWSIASGRIRAGDKSATESWNALQKIKGKPNAEITIYRASPKNELRNGDWVSFSKEYAKGEALSEGVPVNSFKVKAKDIIFAGDDINEFGYWGHSTKTKQQLKEIWNKANKP